MGKLLKFELQSGSRLLLPLYIAAIILSALTAATIKTTMESIGAVTFIVGLINVLYVVVIIAIAVVTSIMIVLHFQRNLMGSQGYLMFSLPVTTGEHIFAKALGALIWTILSIIVSGITLFILLTFGQDSVAEAFEAYRYAMSVFGQLVRENMLTTILLVFLFIAAIIGSIMKFYASIAVGHLWGSHPIMGAVIAYIVFGIIESNLFFLCVTVSKRFLDAIDLMIESETLPPVAAGTFLAIAVVYTLIYGFITWFVLDKKLNLE